MTKALDGHTQKDKTYLNNIKNVTDFQKERGKKFLNK